MVYILYLKFVLKKVKLKKKKIERKKDAYKIMSMSKPDFGTSEQQRCRTEYASAQSDHRLYFSLSLNL